MNPETTTPNGCGAQLKLMQDTTEKYFIKNGTAYCQLCHDNLFLPRCNGCNDFIRQSGDGDGKIHFYRHENESFCAKCYEEKFVPLCSRCNTRFKRMESGEMDKFVVVGGPEGNGGVRLHRSCFNCEKCHRQFDQQVKAYLWKQTNLVCREHYEELSSSNE